MSREQNQLRRAGAVAVAAVSACSVAWFFATRQFYIAYLAAVLFPWSVSLGSLTLIYIGGLTGGRWAEVAWPWLSVYSRLMPLVFVLFVPWLAGIDTIYPWSDREYLAAFEATAHRQWFYQTPFFVGRTISYFVVWIVLAWLPRANAPHLSQLISALGAIAILLSVTWATMDWIQSIDPFFVSTLFGVLVGGGAMLAGLSAAVVGVCYQVPVRVSGPDEKTLADLSSLLLAMLLLWAYFAFSQFLIQWSGNLPAEANYYLVRSRGVWAIITPLLAVFGLVVPFLCLLSYRFKRSPRSMGALAVGLLIVRLVELAWLVIPAADGDWSSTRLLLMVPAVVAVTAIYIFGIVWLFAQRRSNDSLPAKDSARLSHE